MDDAQRERARTAAGMGESAARVLDEPAFTMMCEVVRDNRDAVVDECMEAFLGADDEAAAKARSKGQAAYAEARVLSEIIGRLRNIVAAGREAFTDLKADDEARKKDEADAT